MISNHEIRIVGVERSNYHGQEFNERLVAYACVPPNGPIRAVGSAANDVFDASIAVDAVAKKWVALSFSGQEDPDTSEEVRKVINVATGALYAFSGHSTGPQEEHFNGAVADIPLEEKVLLNAFGQLACQTDAVVPPIYNGTAPIAFVHESEIVGFESNGKQRVLDSAQFTLPGGAPPLSPLSLLALEGHTVRWTNAGVSHSATL